MGDDDVARKSLNALTEEPCEDCGSEYAWLGPCPYAYEIHGDDTPCWLCDACAWKRWHDV